MRSRGAGTPAAELAVGGAAEITAPRADALAATLDGLLRDPSRRAELGRAARRATHERYDPRLMARAYEALYDRLLG